MFMAFIAGMLLGLIMGFIAFAIVQRELDKDDVREGMIRLDGKYYILENKDISFRFMNMSEHEEEE